MRTRTRRHAQETDKAVQQSNWKPWALVILGIALLVYGAFFVAGVFQAIERTRLRNQASHREFSPRQADKTFPVLISDRLAQHGFKFSGCDIDAFGTEGVVENTGKDKPLNCSDIVVKVRGINNLKTQDGSVSFLTIKPGEKTKIRINYNARRSDIESITLDLK